jgi:hypothetical protein
MSEVWVYFKEVGKKAKCKLCGAEVPRTQGSTTGVTSIKFNNFGQ